MSIYQLPSQNSHHERYWGGRHRWKLMQVACVQVTGGRPYLRKCVPFENNISFEVCTVYRYVYMYIYLYTYYINITQQMHISRRTLFRVDEWVWTAAGEVCNVGHDVAYAKGQVSRQTEIASWIWWFSLIGAQSIGSLLSLVSFKEARFNAGWKTLS